MNFVETVGNGWQTGKCSRKSLSAARWLAILAAAFALSAEVSTAQSSSATESKNKDNVATSAIAGAPEPLIPSVRIKSLPSSIFVDQKNIWTDPFHMNATEWKWGVPLIFAGVGLVASDTAIEKHAPSNTFTVSHAVTASNAGLAVMAGAGGGMFLWGHLSHDDQKRETGVLSGEAAINALLDTEAIAYAAGRNKPFSNNAGRFFKAGSSFPSQHAAVSWAIASMIAHEYPGPMTELLSYGLAGGISAARFAGQKHFASEVIIGSALGWYAGRQVFRAHSHYSDADIAKFGTFSKSDDDAGPKVQDMGSPSVPLDTWVYPVMQRLIALGYIQSADLAMRPWTRMECARLLVEEAGKRLQENDEGDGEPRKLYEALSAEFGDEVARLDGATNLGVSLDSVYTRFTGISGAPLTDGLHFGQTVVNDFGRPYGAGFNSVAGFTSHAVAGPLFFYVRAEYQHAPSIPAYSLDARQTIQNVDGLPSAPPGTSLAEVNRADLLEAYVGLQLGNWQLTFGKQALWWGADESGPMLFSTNSEPILMLQINRVKPLVLPSILKLVGPIRAAYFVGRTGGYHWVNSSTSGVSGSWTQALSDQPFIVGEKLNFKPSENLELGFSITALAGGNGVPFTLHKLAQASFSIGNANPGTTNDPGDHRGGFDIAYRVPKFRDWLTVYADAFTDDQANPWLAWNKTALTSGIYFPKLPKIPKMELRAEGVFTDLPWGTPVVHIPGFFYFNDRFKSGYTNDGNLIGSWIGREGQGANAWATYWLSAKNKLQLQFRHEKVSQQLIPEGGTLTDLSFRGDFWLRSNFGISAWIQYERWLFPVIAPDPSRSVTAAVEFLFAPQKLFRHGTGGSGNQP